ncbi:uncharacterized protein LOC143027451 [Oratosquilla oratoria]|uniref:uncharacterized protein LOC143027451 n=1 Tax=Oratosquilla oratoria TaxID=337810 RepID=UPI003F769A63
MANQLLVLLSLIGFALAGVVEIEDTAQVVEEGQRAISQYLNLDNPFDAGEWGPVSICPNGTFAHAFEVKFEEYSTVDETAINAVKLYCSTQEHHDTGYITSTEGEHGDWYGMKICDKGYLTGMRARVLPYQGLLHDDVAVHDVDMECNYGTQIMNGLIDTKYNMGKWSSWTQCRPGSAICGLQVRKNAPRVVVTRILESRHVIVMA